MDLHDIFLASTIISGSGGSIDLSDYYSKSEVDQRIVERIAEIVAGAPEDFNTLGELSDWIANHEDSAAAMNSVISANTAAIAQKVDKVNGKGLSTNDFTNALKTKLTGLENYDDTEIKSDIAKTDEQVALNRSTLGYQRKNFLMNNCQVVTKSGVTATVNADKSITLTGSNTLGSAFVLYVNMQTGNAGTTLTQYANNKKWIPNGDYILSGSAAGANIQIRLAEIENSEGELISSNNGNEIAFTVTDTHKYVWSRVLISANADFGSEGVTIYPMIRSADITDDIYEPYRPSVAEYIENNIVILDSEEEFNNLANKTADFYFIKEE